LGLVVITQGWNEPFLALAVGLSLWCVVRRKRYAFAVALAAVVGLKQYGLLWLVVPWWARCLTWRNATTAVVLVLLVILPFVLCNPGALWRGVVLCHLDSPFRPDSLSISAAVFSWTGWQPPAVLGFLAALAVVLALTMRRPTWLASASLGGAGVYLAFVLFGKAGHLNYYWFVAFLLATAISLAAREGPRPSTPESPAVAGQRRGSDDGRFRHNASGRHAHVRRCGRARRPSSPTLFGFGRCPLDTLFLDADFPVL
jgi:hypothetical protein